MRSTLGVMVPGGVQILRMQQSSSSGGHFTGSQQGLGGQAGLHTGFGLQTGLGLHLGSHFGLHAGLHFGSHFGLHAGFSTHAGLHEVCSTDSANAPAELHNVAIAQIAKNLDVILTSIGLLYKCIKIQHSA